MLSILKTLSLLSGSRGRYGPDLPSPCGRRFYISFIEDNPDFITGKRGHGGVAIFWKQTLDDLLTISMQGQRARA